MQNGLKDLSQKNLCTPLICNNIPICVFVTYGRTWVRRSERSGALRWRNLYPQHISSFGYHPASVTGA